MKTICNTEKCTGCETCRNICPHNAIEMRENEEGFCIPYIHSELCTNCGLCVRRCPVNTEIECNEKPLKIFSGWSNDEATRISSSSGGAFVEIAKVILQRKGVVFGVTMDKFLIARHVYIERIEDLSFLQGSKYVQSIIGDTFELAKEFLNKGRDVLFTGTPCQIAGLRSFLNRNYDNLYTIDLICHGVPSPKLFRDYLQYVEKRINTSIKDVKFRCKKSSWIFFNMGINSHIEKKNDKITYEYEGHYYSDPYIRLFLRDNILRPNCYNCRYTNVKRIGDFTIADWWGYSATSTIDKNFDKKGVSLIFCNTEKSVELSDNINMSLRERTLEEAVKTNKSLREPFPQPLQRERFWRDYKQKTFEELIPQYMSPEKINLSTYMRIYYSNYRIGCLIVSLYERIMRKIHLQMFIIKLKAK